MSIDERLEFLLRSTESLHTSVHELYAVAQEHSKQLQQDAENIRSLARIAEAHGQRISDIERSGETGQSPI
jgi:hypothetical protein